MQPKPAQLCPLLSLPGELRNHIYALVVVQSEPIEDPEATLAQASLFQACHQVRHECSEIFWQLNTFSFRVHAFVPLVLETANSIIPRIRHLEIHTGGLCRGPYFLSQYEDHLDEAVVCLDVSKGLPELRYCFRRGDHDKGGKGVRRHPVDGFEVKCTICMALDRVETYLQSCARAAKLDQGGGRKERSRYMTMEVFEGIVRILVPVLE